MPKARHFAFRQEYQGLSFRLITDAEIFIPSPAKAEKKALTGKRGLIF
jgi:hypothetical protein